MMSKQRVVVVGAGFGGIVAAKELAEEDVEVTVVDRHNYHLFQPLLYQVSTAVLSPMEIAYPIRAFFRDKKNVDLFMAKATGVDQKRKVLMTNHGEIPYDYLVLAAGATTNFFGNSNVEKYSYGMKTLQEAEHIRNHTLHMFERANKCKSSEERRRMLTFVVVGGGPTGIEEAGALSELIGVQKKEYPNLDFSEVSIKLLEAADSLLMMMPPHLRDKARDVLQQKGVEVLLNTMVEDYVDEGVGETGVPKLTLKIKNGEDIPTNTVVWAAGVKAVPFIANCGAEVDKAGRIIVEETLLVKGSDSVFAVGDCANFCHGTSHPLPTIAPVAYQGAAVAARNIMRLIRGEKELEKFCYHDLGSMATIGRGDAVVAKSKMNPEMTGFIAWCAWMVVHIWRLAGTHIKVTVALKWIWNLISGARLGRIITNIRL